MLTLNRNRTATALKKIWCLFCTDGSSKGNNNVEIPPEPTNCCMSGCPNCVWIEYATLLAEKFNDSGENAKKIILDKITDPNMKAFLSMELRNIENRPK